MLHIMENSPDWSSKIPEGAFISSSPSYVAGNYTHLFDEYTFACDTVGDITYYVYDPVKHGAASEGIYPVIMWLHGMGNSLEGDMRINYSGAELFASPAYQEKMGGGAYIVVPFANETRLENGEVEGYWSEEYVEVIRDIYMKVCEKYQDNAGKRFVFGTSAGGFLNWELTKAHPEIMDVSVIISGGDVPADEELDRIAANNVTLLVAHGQNDELISFGEEISPRREKLEQMPDCSCYFPEWVRNGDGGIASVMAGREMGQHCLVNQFQANLIYDDGTCYDEQLPEGVTGWIRNLAAAEKKGK